MKKIVSLLLCAALLLCLLPMSALASDITYRYVKTANYGSLNLREDTSTSSEVLTTIPYGTKIKLIDYTLRAQWANVTYNGYYGYVQVRYLSTSKPEKKPTPTPKPEPEKSIYDGFLKAGYLALVTPRTPTGFVHMRWAPSKSEPIFADYHTGDTLVVLYENKSWCMVYDEVNHVSGYMMKDFLNYSGPWEQNIGDGAVTEE